MKLLPQKPRTAGGWELAEPKGNANKGEERAKEGK
jgi:hypothetical protein